HITCPRCNGTGHIRDTESSALQILRMVQEEAMKDNTAAVHVQVPVEVTSFLLNEKRTEISKIELKQRVTVLLVPNKHLETPNYKLERLRHDDPRLENLQASYTMIEEPTDEVGITRRGDVEKKNKQEPVIKGILPEQPAPVAAPKPEPVAAPAPAPVVAPPPPAPQAKGFFSRLFSFFGGGEAAPAPAPAAAAPAAAPAATDKPKREGGRDGRGRDGGRRGERSDRGDRGERGEGRGQGGQGGRRDGKPQEARGDRPERGDRKPRGEGGDKPEQQQQRPERAERAERGERPDRQERGERGERGERRPRGERQERAPAETVAALPVAAPLSEELAAVHDAPPAFVDSQAEAGLPPTGDTPVGEERQGRGRRRRRGGRDRDDQATAGSDATTEAGAEAATPVTAEGATEGDADAAPAVEGDDTEGHGRESRRRGGRNRNRNRREEGAVDGQEAAAGEPAAAAADAAAPVQSSLIEDAMANAAAPAQAAVSAPVQSPAPVAAAPAPAPVAAPAPVVEAFKLPMADLNAIAAGAGLQWVNSDAYKIAAVQAAIAAEPAPAPLGREPAAVVVIDEGPLVLVETRKDLSQVKLPFEA
ncbi:MAG: ribonuclease E/G, partial [Burkholderiales bacterium]|nr:ribonuclease E/G [Burkholderiales bacterium]